ncbi:hypothetical protein ACFVWT_18960 [Arthrobacter sp. NPDC058288]|uniref:hypothetical protein n=1 Tax=Arthrobacter sp. NPDC058288 TaxID=3346424 RepID=UPI0036EA05FA
MLRRRFILPAGLLITALALTTFVLITAQQPSGQAVTVPGPVSAAARTSFPGLAAAGGEPDLPGLHAPGPGTGQVVQIPGPLDDRFVLEGLAFNGSAVSGTVRTTGTLSDLLDLQVLAGFYDDRGSLLGTARFVHHRGSEETHPDAPEGHQEFAISVPAQYQGAAVSAAVGVPVLVNE